MKTALHIATCCIFGWSAEHFVRDSQNSDDDFSVLLVIYFTSTLKDLKHTARK